MKKMILLFLFITTVFLFFPIDKLLAQQPYGPARAPWDQLEDPSECDFRYFIAGSRYANAATKKEILRACGQPDHVPQQEYFFFGGHDGAPGSISKGREEWYYIFENQTVIFIFNNIGTLVEKKIDRR